MADRNPTTPMKPLIFLLGLLILLSICGLIFLSFNYLDDIIVEEEPPSEEQIVEEKPAGPVLMIKIIEYPGKVDHVCQQIVARVRVTNEGTEPIMHADIYDYSDTHNFYYSVNNEILRSTNFSVKEGDIETSQKVGLEDFGTLQPGETKEVLFFGGGMVSEFQYQDGTQAMLSSQRNILDPAVGGQLGANTIQLVWATKYDSEGFFLINPEIVTASEVMNIELLSDQCDESDIQESEPL